VSARRTVWSSPTQPAILPVMVVLTHHRAADDFEAIRARMDELRRERTEAVRGEPIASAQPSSPSPLAPGDAANPDFVDASMD
jgi:hypothetical protein